jgi:amidophosphoribosyltransferase
VAPCFYGIDMSTISELFAPPFLADDRPREEAYVAMARALGADSLRYLPVESISRAVARPASELCQACITGKYPTPFGRQLYEIARQNNSDSAASIDCDLSESRLRTYESVRAPLVSSK